MLYVLTRLYVVAVSGFSAGFEQFPVNLYKNISSKKLNLEICLSYVYCTRGRALGTRND